MPSVFFGFLPVRAACNLLPSERMTMHRRVLQAGLSLLTFCTAPQCLAEEMDAADAPARSHVDVELTAIAVGISGAGHVGARWYVGGGVSLLPAVSLNTFTAYPIELAEAHGFVRWAPVTAFQVDAGIRGTYFQYFRICVFDPCTTTNGTLVGPYIDVRAGFRSVKAGPRLAYMGREDGVWGAMFYPLVLRFQFT